VKEAEKFSWKKRAKSFSYAFAGIVRLLRCEHNARIHVVAAIAVAGCGWWLGLSAMEWVAISLCIGGVFVAEAVNSAVETLADRVTGERDEAVKHAKDLAAGAVLLMALTDVVVGLIVFLPKIMRCF